MTSPLQDKHIVLGIEDKRRKALISRLPYSP